MARLGTSLLLTLVLVAAIGIVGRPGHTDVAPPGFQWFDAGERFEAKTALCTGATTPVQTSNTNLILDDGTTYQEGTKCATPQNEPSVAVNPADPLNVVAGANDFRLCCDAGGDNNSTAWAYVSKDGGKTWTNVLVGGLTLSTGGKGLFKRFDTAEDPSIAFTPNGTAYFAAIVFASRTNASGIAVASSPDGGLTWNEPVLVKYSNDPSRFNDKSWVAAGANGEVAVTWTRFHTDRHGGTSTIEGSVTRDGATWSKPVRLSSPVRTRNWGATPVWAADGTLYTVFLTSRNADELHAIAVSQLHPGGQVQQRQIARVYDGPTCFAINGNMRPTLTGESFRVSPLPAASLDPVTQTLAIVWLDGERGCKRQTFTGVTNAQVKLVFVHGSHASTPRIVTSGTDKALPAVGYRDRRVVVGYYTRGFAPADCLHRARKVCLDYAYSTSDDGFSTEHRLSDASSNPFAQFDGAFIGDYSGLAVGSDGVAHAVWTDSRGGDQNIFFQSFQP
jgi:hypothetical protein